MRDCTDFRHNRVCGGRKYAVEPDSLSPGDRVPHALTDQTRGSI